MSWKDVLWVIGSAGAALLGISLATGNWLIPKRQPREVLSRLKSDGSYSQDQPIRLSYPVFLPARQHARLAIEITQPFNWPSDTDSGSIEKLRNFVKQRLQNVGEFVLFDEANHRQLELPSGWEQLEETSQESD